MKKRYLNDPTIPVPRRTSYQKAAYGKTFSHSETLNAQPENYSPAVLSENEEETTQETDSQTVLSGNETLQFDSTGVVHEDGKMRGPEYEINENESEVELNVKNNMHYERGDTDKKLDVYNVEGSNSDSDSLSGVEFENTSSDSSCSDDESSEFLSDVDIEDEQLDNNKCRYTALQLQSFAMIAYLVRHNSTGVAVDDLLSLVKVICSGFEL